jgi:acyl carrier protein
VTQKSTIERLRALMARTSQAPNVDWNSVTEQSTIASLGIDSLAMLDLLYDVQQEFQVEFDLRDLSKVATVGQLATFIDERLRA